jgi:hypothetical protein
MNSRRIYFATTPGQKSLDSQDRKVLHVVRIAEHGFRICEKQFMGIRKRHDFVWNELGIL